MHFLKSKLLPFLVANKYLIEVLITFVDNGLMNIVH